MVLEVGWGGGGLFPGGRSGGRRGSQAVDHLRSQRFPHHQSGLDDPPGGPVSGGTKGCSPSLRPPTKKKWNLFKSPRSRGVDKGKRGSGGRRKRLLTDLQPAAPPQISLNRAIQAQWPLHLEVRIIQIFTSLPPMRIVWRGQVQANSSRGGGASWNKPPVNFN